MRVCNNYVVWWNREEIVGFEDKRLRFDGELDIQMTGFVQYCSFLEKLQKKCTNEKKRVNGTAILAGTHRFRNT